MVMFIVCGGRLSAAVGGTRIARASLVVGSISGSGAEGAASAGEAARGRGHFVDGLWSCRSCGLFSGRARAVVFGPAI